MQTMKTSVISMIWLLVTVAGSHAETKFLYTLKGGVSANGKYLVSAFTTSDELDGEYVGCFFARFDANANLRIASEVMFKELPPQPVQGKEPPIEVWWSAPKKNASGILQNEYAICKYTNLADKVVLVSAMRLIGDRYEKQHSYDEREIMDQMFDKALAFAAKENGFTADDLGNSEVGEAFLVRNVNADGSLPSADNIDLEKGENMSLTQYYPFKRGEKHLDVRVNTFIILKLDDEGNFLAEVQKMEASKNEKIGYLPEPGNQSANQPAAYEEETPQKKTTPAPKPPKKKEEPNWSPDPFPLPPPFVPEEE